jgi:hypothetical protein
MVASGAFVLSSPGNGCLKMIDEHAGREMAEAYVVLWALERCRWLQRVGDEGPIEVVFGGPHTSQPSIAALRSGDVIYPVAVAGGALRLIARLPVDTIMSPQLFVRERLGIESGPHDMWDTLFHELRKCRPDVGHRVPITCADHAAVGRGTKIVFDRNFPADALRVLRFGAGRGKEQPLAGVANGRLENNLSLQGRVRRLSTESATLFAEQF